MSKKNKSRGTCVRCSKSTNKGNKLCSECNKRKYHKNYYKTKMPRKNRHTECVECGGKKNIMPYKGLCRQCYLIERILKRDELRK